MSAPATPSRGRAPGAPGDGAAVLDLDDPRWLGFVAGRPEASGFHHPAWSRVLAEAYGFRPFALALAREDGSLAAGLPLMEVRGLRGRRWISLPFTDNCPPLAGPDDEPRLLSAVDSERRRAGIGRVEIRAPAGDAPWRRFERGVLHARALGADAEAVKSTFAPQVRRDVARAEREGVSVFRGERRGDLVETFYRLHLQTRRRHGVPIQPRRFFELLWERVLEPGLGFVLIAEGGGESVAAAVFLAWNRTLTYKFGASDPAAWGLRPNHALFWEAIRWACDHGYATLDLGRSDLANEGLRMFKSRWGASESELVYSALGEGAERRSGRLERALGVTIRHSPSWVCRLTGELLYKQAA